MRPAGAKGRGASFFVVQGTCIRDLFVLRVALHGGVFAVLYALWERGERV